MLQNVNSKGIEIYLSKGNQELETSYKELLFGK